MLDRLRRGLETIAGELGVILLDPPPALGMIPLSVLRAASALLVSAPPFPVRFGSTAHVLRMLATTLGELGRAGGTHDYGFVKILVTKVGDAKSAHVAIRRMMDQVDPHDRMRSVLEDSAEIDDAAAALRTVCEVTGPAARTDAHRRCRARLDAVGREVETPVRKTWPSHHGRLAKEGMI